MKLQETCNYFLTVFLAAFMVFVTMGSVTADPIDDTEDVPATAAEIQFIDQVINQVKASVPVPEGWNRDVSVTASGNSVREGKPVMIFERARHFPLKINMQLNFKSITVAQVKRETEEKSAEELQQEMMAAANAGDMQKMAELQQQVAAMLQSQMTAGPLGQAAGMSPMAPAEKPVKFHVQVIVNGAGASVGKEYDMTVPGVTHALRVDKGKEDLLSYKYYLGAWEISELNNKNWRIVSPDKDQTAANHLKAMVVQVNLYGDRGSVESYLKNSLDLNGLKGILN